MTTSMMTRREKKLRARQERMALLQQQTDLFKSNCSDCPNISNNTYCAKNCPIGKEMIKIGKALGSSKEPSVKKIDVSKDEYLKLKSQGLSNKQIADHFGVSDQLIRNRRRDWGLSEKRKKPYVLQTSEITKEQLIQAEREGLSNEETANRLHVSRAKIIRLRKEYGLSRSNSMDKHRPEYERLRAQGMPLKKIAITMGVNTDSVMRWRRAWGLKGEE